MLRGKRRVGLALLICWGLGCVEPGQGAEETLARARPRVQSFVRFDAWARRALGADAELGRAEALEETLFAPIRRESGVLAAEVVRVGVMERRLAFRAPEALAEGARWVDLRGVGEDDLSAAIVTLRDPRAPGAPEVVAIVLRRLRVSGPASTLEVRVAYAPETEPPP